MSLTNSTAAVHNGGNRFFLPNGNGLRLSEWCPDSSLPAGKDASSKPVPPESLRWVGRSLQVSQSWLISHFDIPLDVLADALDEVMSWGVQLDFSKGVWFDRRLFNQVLLHQPLKIYFTAEDKACVFSILEPKK